MAFKKGYKMNKEQKEKIKLAKLKKYGCINPIKAREKVSNFMKEQWKNNKDLWLERNKNNLFKKGFDNKRNKNQIFSKNHEVPETWKQKMKIARAKQIIPIKDTKIEIKIQNFLKQLNIEFYAHQYMNIKHAYQCDLFIPSINMIIECDGDYWHCNKNVIKNPEDWQLDQLEEDKIRTQELQNAGFKILRLWESEIKKMDIDKFKNMIGKYGK